MSPSKILLVHYDPKALAGLRKTLESGGFEVEEARDGSTAMAKFLETAPDIVLLEAMLPRVHGFEVCQDLKKTRQGRRTPIVVMTTVYKGRKYRDEAIHSNGADEFIEMPMEDSQLISTLERTIRKARSRITGIETGA